MAIRTVRAVRIRTLSLAVSLTGASLIIAASIADALLSRTSLQIILIPVTTLGIGFAASMLGILGRLLPFGFAEGVVTWLKKQRTEEIIKKAFVNLGIILGAVLIHFLVGYLYSLE